MRRFAIAGAFLVCTAVAALAHLVPIPPSTCTFDPLTLTVPATGASGAADPALPADTVRIAFDAPANQIQFCAAGATADACTDAVPRPFTLGTTIGTLTFPAVFNGDMLSSGDVTIADVPIIVTTGAATQTARVTLTTGLAAAGGAVVAGAPLQGLAAVTLVGAFDPATLPPPLTGQLVVLSASCLPRPVPDKDQFAPPFVPKSLVGHITADGARIRATADVPSVSPPDLSGAPTVVALDVGGTIVASGVVSGGLGGRGNLSGTSDDGRTAIEVRSSRRGATSRIVLTVRFDAVTLPPQSPGAPVLVDLVIDAGGVIGRGEQLFRVSRDGRRVHGG